MKFINIQNRNNWINRKPSKKYNIYIHPTQQINRQIIINQSFLFELFSNENKYNSILLYSELTDYYSITIYLLTSNYYTF